MHVAPHCRTCLAAFVGKNAQGPKAWLVVPQRDANHSMRTNAMYQTLAYVRDTLSQMTIQISSHSAQYTKRPNDNQAVFDPYLQAHQALAAVPGRFHWCTT